MKKELKFVVNGNPYDIWVEPNTLLVQVLRDELGLKFPEFLRALGWSVIN